MKHTMARILSLVICLALLLCMAPGVSAQTEDDGTIGAQIRRTAGTANAPVSAITQTHWNPRLGEEPEESDSHLNRHVAAVPDKGYIFYDSTPVENIMSYLINQMTARKNVFAVTYQTTMTYDYDAFANALFEAMQMHTGVGKEGDYLSWMWREWNCSLFGYEKQYITYTFTVSYLTSAAQEQQVDAAVATLLSSLNLNGCTDYQKVKKIYDWMCANITYDHTGLAQGIENSPLSWTAYKALIYRTSVCQGYATLFYRLALECGIDARVITGNPLEPHGWNIVKLGDRYYNLDSTWDAELSQKGYSYQFFLRSPANFVDHIRDTEYNTAEFNSAYPMSNTDYVPGSVTVGDMNGDAKLTTDDAVHLLLNIMFGAGDYSISAQQRRDTNGDGKVTTDDAVHLLLHVMFGAVDYPLAS